ncbi:aldo/keto reductase [Gluconacetobacter diazotrophicus]|uniref:aldo/keto reductase n=1 Tax=Gluconacetobacter diazotrophicus TaxID=33996 RepID=UPI00287B7037|nr:aldo/keto reductase [Gluconacetobacter diazotrophicus]
MKTRIDKKPTITARRFTRKRWTPIGRRSDADRAVIEAVGLIAKQRGVSRAQVALAWVLQKQGISAPIIGASKPGHLNDALAALSIRLTADEIAALEQPYIPHPVVGF